MTQFHHLHNRLLNEEEMDISYAGTAQIRCDNAFELLILLKFQLTNLEKLDHIVAQFYTFLDKVSQ